MDAFIQAAGGADARANRASLRHANARPDFATPSTAGRLATPLA
jgi:hypothetical protein